MKRGSVVLGMAVLWAAYGVAYTGYVWLRGYDISFLEIWAPVHYYQGNWPPAKIPATQVIPSRKAS